MTESSRGAATGHAEGAGQDDGMGQALVVVAGGGSVGLRAIFELHRTSRTALTLIERDPDVIASVRNELQGTVRAVEGDALDDQILQIAGVQAATGFVAALDGDRDNLFLCLAVRQMNPSIRIVARIEDETNAGKFLTVGADQVVGAAQMGGQRLAHASLRPALASFADGLSGTEDRPVMLREFEIVAACGVAGQRLAAAGLQERTGCVVLGHRPKRRAFYNYHPAPETRLKPGGTVLALGAVGELDELACLLCQPGIATA